jgi:hypothetical protein
MNSNVYHGFHKKVAFRPWSESAQSTSYLHDLEYIHSVVDALVSQMICVLQDFRRKFVWSFLFLQTLRLGVQHFVI